jgi:hypothetical protein
MWLKVGLELRMWTMTMGRGKPVFFFTHNFSFFFPRALFCAFSYFTFFFFSLTHAPVFFAGLKQILVCDRRVLVVCVYVVVAHRRRAAQGTHASRPGLYNAGARPWDWAGSHRRHPTPRFFFSASLTEKGNFFGFN